MARGAKRRIANAAVPLEALVQLFYVAGAQH